MDKRIILDDKAIDRTLTRIAHEILENNKGAHDLVLLGIRTRGIYLAQRIQSKIEKIDGIIVPTGVLDVTQYRDDVTDRVSQEVVAYTIDTDMNNKHVVIVDDVLYTGRTVRASLDAILDHVRPKRISLATLVDRGHRELPIRADFIGKNIPTALSEEIVVMLDEIDDKTQVYIK
ncbi:bifunctional pyr operon transcriptional regulator/uracil phosphoribosyltransferase PyrR [Macrococcoides canis]|uniref:bifunctional pyr operon transcriptional regulator/uracil phosphoribosyltransferase PyrR n=1 Tax=Macrococcoides canis TaxID=1855823 RepID=UPI0013E92A87|nr:bifunctional pyr operon transcriptional regulator/uracil phosphoribosyltransferase PyrR [Macrococcus canis]MCO4096426.1 bifunctional pyr operon transcriptional regulator/uracil phosphoribosyltransferase PyrR [Macrococcus canis]QIH75666.1 bifunctional pyr operon transcriptional regulator/uracil phosphoribosyltransferase PyrR [Macrococcus canis]QTQ09070.1 bifunctional pyr operon transcriptional regulator/uracil phosphoribosyltransferase PyrR [Macrococcus canis]UJS28730.1 bifunctional pyr opero